MTTVSVLLWIVIGVFLLWRAEITFWCLRVRWIKWLLAKLRGKREECKETIADLECLGEEIEDLAKKYNDFVEWDKAFKKKHAKEHAEWLKKHNLIEDEFGIRPKESEV